MNPRGHRQQARTRCLFLRLPPPFSLPCVFSPLPPRNCVVGEGGRQLDLGSLSGVISTVVQDSPHKIFIGGLPNYLNEDQVRWPPALPLRYPFLHLFLSPSHPLCNFIFNGVALCRPKCCRDRASLNKVCSVLAKLYWPLECCICHGCQKSKPGCCVASLGVCCFFIGLSCLFCV